MPESDKGEVILRQWEMLRLVPPHDQAGRSAQELVGMLEVRGFAVTRRTVERDLERLQQSMPLEVDATARPRRWRWRRQKALDIPGMEVAEAMALFMMREALRAHLPDCFHEALRSRYEQAEKTLHALARWVFLELLHLSPFYDNLRRDARSRSTADEPRISARRVHAPRAMAGR